MRSINLDLLLQYKSLDALSKHRSETLDRVDRLRHLVTAQTQTGVQDAGELTVNGGWRVDQEILRSVELRLTEHLKTTKQSGTYGIPE